MKIPDDEKIGFKNAFKIICEWNAQDTCPWMKRNTVNYLAAYVGYFSTLILLVGHYFWAVDTLCNIHFQRSGAAIVLLSAILFGVVEWHKTDAAKLGGSKIKDIKIFERHIAIPLIAVLGTFVWGYGDIVSGLPKTGCM